MADDWDTVTVLRKRAPNKATMKSETAVNQARRQGAAIDTQQKCKYPRPRLSCSYAWNRLQELKELGAELESHPARTLLIAACDSFITGFGRVVDKADIRQ